MIVREMMVSIDDVNDIVRDQTKIGFGIACMYVKEQSDYESRALETIMVSQDEVLRISAYLADNTYTALTPENPAANIYEREIAEMSNILPLGHSDLRPLKLRKTWTDSYPMQKAEDLSDHSRPVLIPRNGMVGEGVFEIPVGPIHAGVIEPGHFRFSVAGEPILMLRTYLGYTYRGIEKLMETSVKKNNIHLIERVSGDNAIAHSLAYLQAIERDTEIPMRARFIRTILAEMERIYYLISGMAGIALDTALSVPAQKGYMLKERMLRLNERITGHRMLWGTLKVGGVKKDLSENDIKDIENEVVRLKFEVDEMFDVMMMSSSFLDRAETTGVLSNQDAVRLRTVGPVARASGVEYDVRKHHPYEAYGLVGMKVSTHTSCDVYARLKVKKNEILESISIITQCITSMDKGGISCEVEFKDGFSMGMTESPRGEVIHCMHVINGNIWRYKIRDASFPNWPAIESAVMGNIVPDFPLINKSFDLSYSGNDL